MLLLTSGNVEDITGMNWVQIYEKFCAKGEEEIYDHHRQGLFERIKLYKSLGYSIEDAVCDYWADQPWDNSGDPFVDYTKFNKDGIPQPLA